MIYLLTAEMAGNDRSKKEKKPRKLLNDARYKTIVKLVKGKFNVPINLMTKEQKMHTCNTGEIKTNSL